jgi:hypothetical protein
MKARLITLLVLALMLAYYLQAIVVPSCGFHDGGW